MQVAFETLKEKLKIYSVLAYTDFDQPFIVETHLSGKSIFAVLEQEKLDWRIHPIQFLSSKINSSERNYSPCEREAIAVIFPLRNLWVYFVGVQVNERGRSFSELSEVVLEIISIF